MKKFLIPAILIAVAIAISQISANTATPDFSTPDGAFNAMQQARKDGKYELILEGLSEFYKEDYGLTGPDAASILQSREKEAKKKYPEVNKPRTVKKVEYSLKKDRAKLHLSGERFVFMMKEGNKWVAEYHRPMGEAEREKMNKTIGMLKKMSALTDPSSDLTDAKRKQVEAEVEVLSNEVSANEWGTKSDVKEINTHEG